MALAPVVIALVLVVVHFGQRGHTAVIPSTASPSTRASLSHREACAGVDTARRYVGAVVYRPQQVTLPQFIKLTGIRPSIIEYYVDFGSTLNMARAAMIYQASAFPLVQIDPYHTSLRAIAQGRYDAYLRAQARAVARFRCPIAVSFGHEMNGTWYSWGLTHVSPAIFVSAWRHIGDVFASAGTRNVIWVWTVNRVSPGASPLREWWPGQRYVDWVGLDGYYRTPKSTYTQIFGWTLREVRGLTHDPILITETAVPRTGSQVAQIGDLFRGARSSGLFGVVWFNVNAKRRWTLGGRPSSALTEFRKDADWFAR